MRVLKKDYNNYRKEKQRFSIVKVSGKTTSVLVGLTIFGGLLLDAPNAQADTTPSYEVASDTSSSTTATNSKEVTLSSTTDKANQASDQTVSSTSNESSQASATSVDNNEASSATSTTNNVATSDASTTSSDITVANNTNTTANDATNNSTTDNTVKVRTKRALPEASSTTNYDVDDIYNYYVSKGGTASKQKVQDLIDYKNNSSRVTAILNLTVDSYWVDQVLNKEVLNAQKFTDSYIDRIITTSGNSLVTTTNSKIDDQIAKLTELQQKYPNSKEVENAIEKLNETKNSVTLENVYNAEKMQDVIDTLNKYGSVSAYDDLEKAAENEQTSGSGELDNAKTDAKAAIDKLENLNDAQKAMAKEAVDNATTTADVTTAQNAATGLDNDMSGLKNSVSDVDTTKNGENYTNASEEAKKAYDEAVSNAQSILDQAGNNATSDEVAVAKKAVEDTKTGLDGTTNLSNAKNEAQAAIDKLENLNDAQKAAAKEAVANATTTADVTTAQNAATGLDNDMSGLKNSVSDVDTTKNGENYTNASEEAKKAYDEAVSNAQSILDQAGNNATSDEVAVAKKAVEDTKTGLDGTTNLSNAKNEAQAAIDKLENLNDKQKAAAKEAVSNATTTADVTTAQNAATGLDNDMLGLKNSVSDVDTTKNGENYTNASEEAKKVYDEAVSNVQAILDKAGNDATSDEVAASKKAVEDAKKALDGTTNLSNAKNEAQAAIDKLENLNDAQKAAAKEAVDNATTTAEVTNAQTSATGLDNDMLGLKNSVSDVDTTKNGENYTNASEEAKKVYDEAVSNVQAILDKAGNDATSDEVAASKKAVEDAKKALDGTTNLSNAKNEAQAAIDKLENLNDAQKAAAKEAVDNATTTAEVTNAQTSATGLDNDMLGLKNSVSDVDTTKNGENYTNASEEAKKVYDEAVSNVQAILDKAGNDATSDEVAASKKAVEDAKKALDGTTNLSNAKNEAQAAIDKLENLNDAQKAAAKEAVDNATTTAEVTNAQTSATGLDNDMLGLKNSVSDVDTTKNGENYTNASEEAKKVYDEAVANAQAILDQAGNSATSDEVAAAKKAVEDAKTGLDGTSNLSNAKADAQAAIDKLENLNDAQKAGFIADVDAASSQQLVEQAVADAKALDSEMAKLRQEVESSNQVKDTTKYANSSDTLKKNYDDLLAVATALVSKNGIDANLATVQQLVSELKAARLALNGVDTKVETNNNTNVNKAKDSLSNKATASLKTTSLPQTGETKENTSLVGAMLATIGGVLGLGLTRRKKEDK